MATKSAGAETRFDFSRLNAVGKRRVERGLLCFAYPDSENTISATCVDFGLHGRGDSFEAARKDLHGVIAAFVDSAYEAGILEEAFNAPDNPASSRHYRTVKRLFVVASAIVRVITFVVRVRRFWLGPELEEYTELAALAC